MIRPKLYYIGDTLANITKAEYIASGGKYYDYRNILNADETQNDFYNTILFTNDGKIVTHGIVYNTLTGNQVDFSNLITSVNSGTNTYDINLNVNNHELTASLKTIHDAAIPSKGSLSSYVIKVPTVSVDIYGRVTALTESTQANIDYVTSSAAAASSTYLLLGHNSTIGTKATVANANVKVTLNGSSVATLITPNISVPKPENILFSNNGDDNTLTKYITTEVNKVATSAMVFKDADTLANITAKTVSNTTNGDTYKVTTGGELVATKSSDGVKHTVVTGDVLIAVVSGNTLKWAYVPSGDDDVVTDVKIGSNSLKTNGIVTLGTAATSNILSGAIADHTADTGLVSASQVSTYIQNFVDASTASYVNAVGDGLKLSNGDGGQILSLDLVSSTLNASNFADLNTAYAVSLSKDKHLMVDLTGTKIVFGNANTDIANESVTGSDSQNIFMNLVAPKAAVSSLQFKPGTGISLLTDANGVLTISNSGIRSASVSASVASTVTGAYQIGSITINGSSTTLYGHDVNTWRPVNAYDLTRTKQILDSNPTTTGTKSLSFGAEFGYTEADSNLDNAEIHIVWANVDASGTVTYSV